MNILQKISKLLNEKYILYTPLLLLLFTFFLKLFLYSTNGFLSYDEVVVWDVSNQPLGIFFNSVSSEPHPVSYYLFLRSLRNFDIFYVRVILSAISTLLMSISVLIAFRYGIWEKYKLSLGVYFYIISYSFLDATYFIKQDILTVPLFFLILNVYILYKDTGKRWALNLTVCLTILMIFLGLRPFLGSVSILFYEFIDALIRRKDEKYSRLIFSRGVIILTFFLTYLLVFGAGQIFNNRYRMDWAYNIDNKLSNVITGGILPLKLIPVGFGEIFLIIFLLLVYKRFHSKNIFEVEKSLIYILLINIILGYLFQGYVRLRYSAVLLILMYMVLSKYLYMINRKVLLITFYALFISSSIIFYVSTKKNQVDHYYDILASSEILKDEKFLWISDPLPYSSVYLNQHTELIPRVIALGSYIREVGEGNHVTYDILQLQNHGNKDYWESRGESEVFGVINRIIEDGYTSVLYTASINSYYPHIAESMSTFFNERCEIKSIQNEKGILRIYYRNCSYRLGI